MELVLFMIVRRFISNFYLFRYFLDNIRFFLFPTLGIPCRTENICDGLSFVKFSHIMFVAMFKEQKGLQLIQFCTSLTTKLK